MSLHTDYTIDNAIIYCQSHSISTVPTKDVPCGHIYGGRPVKIGQFVFDCNAHSTGNSVSGWVLAGNESLQIINTTFWFTSSYTHNASMWREDGAWAAPLHEALNTMRLIVAGHSLGVISHTAEFMARKRAEADAEREKFGAQFLA